MKHKLIVLAAITGLVFSHTTWALTNDLSTKSGNDIGCSLSYYQYTEPGIMKLLGAKLGADIRTTQALPESRFARGELRFALGTVKYGSNGTGSSENNPDWYLEGRGLIGADWNYLNAVISGYTGLGYRFLFNDIRGTTTSGAAGYRRMSNYLYLPLGISHRSQIDGQAKLTGTLELDFLLAGKQYSQLSDTGLGYADISNTQHSGYGLRFSLIQEVDNISVGPYLYYWNIKKSNVVPEIQNGAWTGYGLVEPQNNTLEIGLKASKRF